ncbi:MAG: hypothetical protein KAH17_08000 [Bacteroidales bacterium]|nr:hypothetical protein [Bacteroidales bacterium]
MNNFTTKISILIVILAITIGNQAKAEKNISSPEKNGTIHLIIHTPLSEFILEIVERFKEYQGDQLEDWMFADLLIEEEMEEIEHWMFEELFPEQEELVLEDWMFDTEYYNN